MKQNNIRAVLSRHSLIPVVTFKDVDEVGPCVQHLLSQDIRCIEVTLRTSVAFEAIAHLKKYHGETIDIGVGTVIEAGQIARCKDLGVDFLVSPGLSEHLAEAFESSGIPFIPGVVTPSEIIRGMQLGWDTFKFFPASVFGGTGLLKSYATLFPALKFCPTGGITQADHQDYLALPNVLSVGGSWMAGA